MSEPKLQEALGRVLELKEKTGAAFKAHDLRQVIKAKETETMLLSAEMSLRASIMRRETRENIFYREDYPERDNGNWLKWILVERGTNGGMKFSTEDIPFDRYQFRPA